MKIAIIGYSGSGKSTLASDMSTAYHCPLLHLDSVQFLPDWKYRDRKEAKNMVATFMKQEQWVIDGNYEEFYAKERFFEANQIIFLRFSRFTCLYRAFKRYRFHKGRARESVPGCVEKFDLEFIWWILYEGRKRNAYYMDVCKRYKDKSRILHNQKELDAFIQTYR